MSASRASDIRQQAREALLQQVLSGKWADGERLPSERQLAAELHVSRATLREAIQHLAAQGLLVSRRGSGIYLQRQQDLASLPANPRLAQLIEQPLWRADMLEFRLMFECGTARLAALRADPLQRRQLGAVIERMQQAVAADDVDAEATADAQFHEQLAAAAHNLMIQQFHTSVINSLRQHITRNTYDVSRRRTALSQQQCQQRLQQHQAIYTAIIKRSPEQADEAMRQHILFVGAQFVSSTAPLPDSRIYRPGRD